MKTPLKRIHTHLIFAITTLAVSTPAVASSLAPEPRDVRAVEASDPVQVDLTVLETSDPTAAPSRREALMASIKRMIHGDGAATRLAPYCSTSSIVTDAE